MQTVKENYPSSQKNPSLSSISTNNCQFPFYKKSPSDTTMRNHAVIPFSLKYPEKMRLTRKIGKKNLKTVEKLLKRRSGGFAKSCISHGSQSHCVKAPPMLSCSELD